MIREILTDDLLLLLLLLLLVRICVCHLGTVVIGEPEEPIGQFSDDVHGVLLVDVERLLILSFRNKKCTFLLGISLKEITVSMDCHKFNYISLKKNL